MCTEYNSVIIITFQKKLKIKYIERKIEILKLIFLQSFLIFINIFKNFLVSSEFTINTKIF